MTSNQAEATTVQIPKRFANDLRAARNGDTNWHYNLLIKDHELFLRRLSDNAARFNHWGTISDRDDLFQEACVRLKKYVRKWDETRGRTIEDYVVYNIGADLAKIPTSEIAKRRRPEAPPFVMTREPQDDSDDWCHEINYSGCQNGHANTMTTSYVVARDTERAVAIKRAVDAVREESPLIYKLLLDALVEEGTILDATKKIRRRIRIPQHTTTREYAKNVVQRQILPRLQEKLKEELKKQGLDF